MGKVFDALQRAESERKRRVTGGSRPSRAARQESATAPSWTPVGVQTPARRDSRVGRWIKRTREPRGGESAEVNKRRISLLQPESFAAEQFRTLRAQIDSLAAERPMRTLVVTSAVAGEGKTLSSINLAIVTALGVGRRVLLVDCDLRKPKVAATLGIQPVTGLTEVLMNEVSLDQAIQKVEGINLEILPVRNPAPNPSELLASERMRTVVDELARSYDRVVLDTPACLAVPDAKTVSELADGVVFVVRADQTPQEDVLAALDLLDRRRLLGVVLNGAHIETERYGY